MYSLLPRLVWFRISILYIYIYTCQHLSTVYQIPGILYGWVQGLSGAPDVPHAGNETQVSFVTEGNGVGVFKAPPVSAEGFLANGSLLAAKSSTSSTVSTASASSSSSNLDNLADTFSRLNGPSKCKL